MRTPAFLLLLLITIPGIASAADRFLVKGETVTDQKTRLMWQKGDSFHELGQGMTWYDAIEYVDNKNTEKFEGHADWRLPSMKELSELWDKTRPLTSKDGEPIGLSKAFTPGGSYYLWSGNERNLDNAWYFGLGQREDYFNLKELGDLDQGVKMVRDIKK